MNTHIFEQNAPTHWAAGLPVIPLRPRNKMPAIPQWSQFGSRMPTASEMDHWLASCPKGNIGLPLGPQSGVCVIDIDTEDEELVDAILKCLPKSPWKRVGKKGMALAYRFEGQKNFKLRGADGGMILEFLGLGNQVVMPPSIHPDTGQPYVANSNLWEVLDRVPALGADIEERLRTLLGAKEIALQNGTRSGPLDVVPAGERDIQMIRHAGYLARVVLGIDRAERFSLWDAIEHMHTWVEDFTAKVPGDTMDPAKGVSKLLEFLRGDIQNGRTMPEGWDSGLPPKWRESAEIVQIAELNDGVRWDFEKARKAFDEMDLEDMSENGTIKAVRRILQRVATDPHFDEVAETALIAHLQRTCKNVGLDKRQLRRILNQARKEAAGPDFDNHAAIGKSVLTELERAGEIRYDHARFWQWNGSCFVELSEDDIYVHVAHTVSGCDLVKRNSDYLAIVEVLKRLTKRPLGDGTARGINFANGWVNSDLQVLRHDPRWGATFTLPFEYRPEAASQCALWMQFLTTCWGAEPDLDDRVLALQEMFAATLLGLAPTFQKAFLLFGRSGTGKTQVLNVLRAMLPPGAVANLGPEQWAERFQLTQLVGKTANLCGELPERGLIAGNVFKEVVEGSPRSVERKGQDPFSFQPIAAHWFASNHLPVSRDTSQGFVRRWQILDFNHPVRDEERIENLADLIVTEEREAIAAWALEGVGRLLKNRGYTQPACHHRRLGQIRRISNSVHAFLEDSNTVEFDPNGSMNCREVYDQYVFHVRDLGRTPPVSFERFMQMLEDLDLSVQRDMIGEYVVSGLARKENVAA